MTNQRLGALGLVAVCLAILIAPLGIASTFTHSPVLAWVTLADLLSAIVLAVVFNGRRAGARGPRIDA
jgi:hypothetical protein